MRGLAKQFGGASGKSTRGTQRMRSAPRSNGDGDEMDRQKKKSGREGRNFTDRIKKLEARPPAKDRM